MEFVSHQVDTLVQYLKDSQDTQLLWHTSMCTWARFKK